MKKMIIIAFVLTLISACDSSPSSTYSKAKNTGHDRVVSYFISAQEKNVKDAYWMTDEVLNLGMIPDGSSRNGFASYACAVLKDDFGFTGYTKVEIIDIVKIVQPAQKRVVIGSAVCRN